MIDHGIRPLLERSGDPLILAGVSRETGIYETLNMYANAIKESIHGSPAALGKPRLLHAALEVLYALPGFTPKNTA
jgi:hypothetical protein